MLQNLHIYLSNFLTEKLLFCTPVVGGDISKVFCIGTSTRRLFLKVQDGLNGYAMLEAEQTGLEAISSTMAIHTPQVVTCQRFQNGAFLLAEFVEAKRPDSTDFETFGRQLALLHGTTTELFGLDQDNFISSLAQRNVCHQDWAQFYLQNRLTPQIRLARNSALLAESDIPDETRMLRVLEELFSGITPSLLHGDLWSGNYLISTDGTPYLIDPAIYYGHSEVDLAMSRLFGGFNESFYSAYHEIIPATPGIDERIDIYQLYYLLVHLNLFGESYYHKVRQGLRRFK